MAPYRGRHEDHAGTASKLMPGMATRRVVSARFGSMPDELWTSKARGRPAGALLVSGREMRYRDAGPAMK